MRISQIFLAVSLVGCAWAEDHHGEDAEKEMAGIAFLWPPDRTWSKSNDNTAPCGSSQGVLNRTDFPQINGAVALVAQDESWRIQVSVSYDSNPTSNSDFETLIPSRSITEMEAGHECYPLPNPDAQALSASNGNATLQIQYTSDLFDGRNETYYACADIRYVTITQFHTQIPCFNVTSDNFTAAPDDGEDGSGSATSISSAAGSQSTGGTNQGNGAGGLSVSSAGVALLAAVVAVAGWAGI